jgi:hypothetical protein
MKKVTSHLSGNAYAVLQACPGQTDGDRIRWLVDYFGQVLDARAVAKARAKAQEAQAEIDTLKPQALEIVRDVADEVAMERASAELSNRILREAVIPYLNKISPESNPEALALRYPEVPK